MGSILVLVEFVRCLEECTGVSDILLIEVLKNVTYNATINILNISNENTSWG